MSMYSSRPPFNDDPYATCPRPHPFYNRVQANPTNPILTDIRAHYRGDWSTMLRTYEYVTTNAAHYITKDWVRITDEGLISHAHRVLTRLAAISSDK